MKGIIFLILVSFISSCTSIDYNKDKEKLYIDDGSIQICTKRIMIYHEPHNHFEINENIQKFFILDSVNKVFVKDLPQIWENLGFSSKLYEYFDNYTISSIDENNARYIVIFEKSNIFSSKLHAAELLGYAIWKDGSFELTIDDPESGETLISGTPDTNNSRYLKIWAIRKDENTESIDNSSLINRNIK